MGLVRLGKKSFYKKWQKSEDSRSKKLNIFKKKETKRVVAAATEMEGKKIADQLERIRSVKIFVWNGKTKQENQQRYCWNAMHSW